MYIGINKKTYLTFSILILLTGCENYTNKASESTAQIQTSSSAETTETASALNHTGISQETPDTATVSSEPTSIVQSDLNPITTLESTPHPSPISSQQTTSTNQEPTQQTTQNTSPTFKFSSMYNYYTKSNSTIIIWRTSKTTTGYIVYGTDTQYRQISKIEVFNRNSHAIKLKNLVPATLYHYKIVSKDDKGNKVISPDKTFKTKNGTSSDPVSTSQTPSVTTQSTTPSATTQSSTPSATTQSTTQKAIQKGQVKDFNSGKGLANVKVNIGSQSTLTDTNGFYTLSNLQKTDEAVVNFEKEGYLIGSTKITIKALSEKNTPSPNYVEYALYADDYNYTTETNIDSSRVYVDTANLMNAQGELYSGATSVNLTILDSTEAAFLTSFPGAFKGIDSNGDVVAFTSYGLIHIHTENDKGDTLRLADNSVSTLVFHVPSSETDVTIPLWYYDKKRGLWIEDGYAQKQDNGTYKGEISHLGTWSLNKPINENMGIYTDRILYPDGTPVKNLRIYAVGKNWISTDLSTDENGAFKLEVVPGESFGLQAYHYDEKYSAKFNGAIPALIAGETVNKIQ